MAKQPAQSQDRVFLVVVDETEEMRAALRFASLRAKSTGGKVALLYVIEPTEFMHWMAAEDLSQEENRKRAEEVMQGLSAEVNEWAGELPVLFLREGDRDECVLELIEEEPAISILVLGAATGAKGPGPLVSALTGKFVGKLRIPITIVPGNLNDEQIKAIT
ncbi:MAG: universal stress protein [Alphaproteobacteria bacterium]|jgi:nucleotide-binding universal stress UspA family protein|nr:universal stress protein [Alphaproteobacteria bacterium]MDP7543306.1 universal stress protein [Alphaproteobacteria bacterium]MDP7669324.1 universal stress protein [Alphaproteobacteria bacterium]MEE1561979.1 universal stress protein [Alphaproteobacteria bacterium]|tara:strand:+ start:974 stop:1459 length:486 start_codon:yes stop_codon:yes gene_type:complete